MTTSDLVQQNESQTGKIKTAINSVSTVRSELDELPNEFSHVEMQNLIDGRQEKVLQSWELLYNRQRDILTWPVKELTPDFIEEFKDLIPMETHVNFPTPESEEKETTLLTQYERYIKNVLPDIAKIAKAEWTAEFEQAGGMAGMDMDMGGMGGYGGGMSMRGATVDITGAKEGPLVKWSTGSQSSVLSDLFPWRGKRPTTLEVYYSQENIWILKQMLQIIADVNGDATQTYQAKIHEIRKIGIGKSVRLSGAGNISKPGSRVGGMGGMGGMDMDMMDAMGGMDEMDMMDMVGDGGGGLTVDPGDNRYVNASLEPISGAQLRSALTSNSPTDASLAVAKRVPVMMSLSVDQRAINELLAACGSAQLMVQINQVRVLPNSESSGGGGGGMMGGMADEMDMEMDMGGGMGGMGGGMGGGGGAASMGAEEEFPLDMAVEIYGIIQIYNPPDPVKFGVEAVTEDTVIDGETETIGGQAVAKPPAAETAPPAQDNGELPTPQAEPAPAATPEAPAPEAPAPEAPAPEAPAPDATAPDATAPVTSAPNPAAAVARVSTTTPPAAIIPTVAP
jgi:hypothetical protein